MAENILEFRGISKQFPGVRALDDVTFSIRRAEIHGLIGENGAGKSTLMKVLMGIYRADCGEVVFDGKIENISSPFYATSIGIGMVPQELDLNPFVSVKENIFLGNELRSRFGSIDWKKTTQEARRALEMIGASIDPNQVVNQLSVAQQQLVQIARALMTGAKLLVFDEPTASLTSVETEFLLKLMFRLKEQGKTIIFISHHLDELIETTDRITVMRDGRMVCQTDTRDASMSTLIEHMAGRKVQQLSREDREISPEVILKVENFCRKGEFSGVSFEVRRGEIFGLGGLVGAGRTELVSTVFGIRQPDSGRMFFEGREVRVRSPHEAIELGIGYVPEERRLHGIFPELSVRENMVVSIYRKLFKGLMLRHARAEAIARDYIDRIRIKTPATATLIRSLSGGNQQKVILSRWLIRNSKLLILDEPTRGIDVNAKSEIYGLIRDLARQGITIIVVSSEQEELLLLTDRVMIMHEGAVKGFRDTVSLREKDILDIALRS
jgi:ABC-type sugar transport system ATPase subunit